MGDKEKKNIELCVIRERSVLIPVNHQISIIIPMKRARQPLSPTPPHGN